MPCLSQRFHTAKTQSYGLSFNAVSGLLAGGAFAGFRHATIGEVATFFGNAGITALNTSFHDPAPEYAKMADLQTLVGFTIPTAFIAVSAGATGSAGATSGSHQVASLTRIFDVGGLMVGTANVPEPEDQADSFASESVDHWLVRAVAVPEPASLTLFALGLAGLEPIQFNHSRSLLLRNSLCIRSG